MVAFLTVGHVAAENPLGQVIKLLDSLAAKVTAEGVAEEKAFKEFMEWCDDAAANKKFELKTANTQKEKLEATIDKTKADAEASTSKIEELAGAIAASTKDLKDATVIREKESSDFKASETELVDVIGTLGRAIQIIEREMSKNPAAFAQVDASNMDTLVKSLSTIVDAASFSVADQKRLSALLQSRSDDSDDLGAPDPAAYKSHSSGILDVLEDLKEKAEEQLSAIRKAESNAKHNYNMLKQSLEDDTANNEKDLADEKAAKSASMEENAKATGDLENTKKDIADAEKTLETAQTSCMTTAADHDATVAARKEELKVIAQAKQILTDTTSGAESQTYSFIQLDGTAKTQVTSRLRTHLDLAGVEVVTVVKSLAKKMHSQALAQLASKINAIIKYGSGAGEDPFVKVKGLIRDMIAKLEAEAGAAATEKAYCDEQISKTEAKKGELEFDMNKLTAKIDKAASESASLKSEVKELQKDLANLAKTQAEMDKIRMESNSNFQAAKSDLETGLEGVRKALGVLRDYYGNSGAALVQQPAAPETHSKAEGAGGSIISILEVVESDFAKNLAKIEMEEEDEASEYEKVSQENKITKSMKEQDVKYKVQGFKSLDKELTELSNDRATTNEELTAVLEYYSKIKERCIAKPETYEQRAARRTAEIEGLKQALQILENEVAFTQRRKGIRGQFHLGM
jgi:chromosome segregation ATPase